MKALSLKVPIHFGGLDSRRWANSVAAVFVAASSLFFSWPAFSQTCAPPPVGLVGWWPLSGDCSDLVNGDTGIPAGPTNFVAGEVGLAMAFDGASGSVRIPASSILDVGAGGGMSVEAWIKPNNVNWAQPLVEWNSNQGVFNGIGAQYWISVASSGGGAGSIWVNLLDSSLTPHQLSTVPGLVGTNAYQHEAMSYDKASGLLVIYLNGAAVAQPNLGSSFEPNTTSDFYLGLRPAGGGGPVYYNGALDEVSIYNRGLTAAEIQAIYAAGSAGKCNVTNPPSITIQPANQTALAGSTVNLVVRAAGSPPLSYQWAYNGTNIIGATAAILTLPNVQTADNGSYSVTVTNPYGSIVSSNALLTVNTPPFITAQPQGLAVALGAPASFSVTASGDSPLLYQWRFNSSIIAGATNSSLTIAAAQATNAGIYRVTVSNPFRLGAQLQCGA